MKPQRNPSEERLLAYAAGTLSPPEAVVMAAHLAMRPANDAWVRNLQSVGGEFLNVTLPFSEWKFGVRLLSELFERAVSRARVARRERGAVERHAAGGARSRAVTLAAIAVVATARRDRSTFPARSIHSSPTTNETRNAKHEQAASWREHQQGLVARS